MTFLTLLQSRSAPTPVPPYSGPPLTGAPSGGGGASGGWGGAHPSIRRALIAEAEDERARKAVEAARAVAREARALEGIDPPSPEAAPSTLAKVVAGAAVGAGVAGFFAKKARENPEPASLEAFESFSREKPQKKSRKIPVAEGDPQGRPCWTCGVRQNYDEFRCLNASEVIARDRLRAREGLDPAPRERTGTKRVCLTCRKADLVRTFTHRCAVCSRVFESPSQKALVCSDACADERAQQTAESRKSAREPEE